MPAPTPSANASGSTGVYPIARSGRFASFEKPDVVEVTDSATDERRSHAPRTPKANRRRNNAWPDGSSLEHQRARECQQEGDHQGPSDSWPEKRLPIEFGYRRFPTSVAAECPVDMEARKTCEGRRH